MSPLARRLVLGSVALLTVLALAILTLRAAGAPIGLGLPTPTPVPTATPTPTVRASPSPTPADPETVIAEIEAAVRELRGLPAPQIGPPEVIGRAALEAELREIFDADYPEEERRADNLTLRALGLLDQGEDYAELQLELLGAQVIGFYDDIEKRMVLVSERGLDAVAKITYAHEYTHALQDAAFGLDSLDIDAPGQDDRGLARLALVEGDATLTMVLWALERSGMGPEELLEIGETPIPETGDVPPWMLELLEFPYLAGSEFVGQLYQTGGFEAVDEAFADLPASTEQVLHFEKYLAAEAPVDVVVPDLIAALDGGACCWEQVESTPIGEGFIRIWLEALGAPAALSAAEGWGGDRLVVLTGPDDQFALAWRLVWDTDADAAEFVDAYAEAESLLGVAGRLIELESDEVLVVHASSASLLNDLVAAASG